MSSDVALLAAVSTDPLGVVTATALAGAYFGAVQLVFLLSGFTTTAPVAAFQLSTWSEGSATDAVAAGTFSTGFLTLAVVFGHSVVSGQLVAAVLPVAFLAAMTATEVFRKPVGLTVIAPRVEATMWLYLTALPFVAVLAVGVLWLVG